MSKSLQDQLLKAGLANRKQAVKAKKAKNHKEKLKRSGVSVEEEVVQAAALKDAEKRDRDRELNMQQKARADADAIRAQIVQLIQLNRVTERGDIEFRFNDQNIIRTFSVSEKQRVALVNGALAVVRTTDEKAENSYEIVPRKTALKIAERDEALVVLCNVEAEDNSDEDEYAEFKVPDDLMW